MPQKNRSATVAGSHPFTLTVFTDGFVHGRPRGSVVSVFHFDRIQDAAQALFEGSCSTNSWKTWCHPRQAGSIDPDGRGFTRIHTESEFVGWTEHGGEIRHERRGTEHFEVTNASGQRLAIAELLELGRAQSESSHLARRRRWYHLPVYCGHGPVPGVHKRPASSGYFRRVGTHTERRLNALVLREEGEVASRPARQGYNLPSSWDDVHRDRQTGWKAQHKGRKSWDRPEGPGRSLPWA